MGTFESNPPNPSDPQPEPHGWEVYMTRLGSAVAAIQVRLDALDAVSDAPDGDADTGGLPDAQSLVPDAARPWLFTVRVNLQQPLDNGLSSSAEAEALDGMEEALNAALETACDAVQVGRATREAVCEFFYYGASTRETFSAAVPDAMDPWYTYNYSYRALEDDQWQTYRALLYPSPQEWSWIQTRRAVERYQQRGVDVTQPQVVRHMARFSDVEAADAFREAATARGYGVVLSKGTRVAVERADALQIWHLHGVVMEVRDLVADQGGHYLGWGARLDDQDAPS